MEYEERPVERKSVRKEEGTITTVTGELFGRRIVVGMGSLQ